jgi:hypothetical protein
MSDPNRIGVRKERVKVKRIGLSGRPSILKTQTGRDPHIKPTEIPDYKQEEIELWMRERFSLDGRCLPSKWSEQILKKWRYNIYRKTVEAWWTRILEEDAKAERVREKIPLTDMRARARNRFETIHRRAMLAEDYREANVAADRLAVLDGIVTQVVRIERPIQQMSDEELAAIRIKAFQALSDEDKVAFIAQCMELLPGHTLNALFAERSRDTYSESPRAIEAAPPDGLAQLD